MNEPAHAMNPEARVQLNQVSFSIDEFILEAFDAKQSIELIQPTRASLSGP